MLNRKSKAMVLNGLTYGAAFASLFILLSIVGFVFLNGFKLLNFDLITHNYQSVSHIADMDQPRIGDYQTSKTFGEKHRISNVCS